MKRLTSNVIHSSLSLLLLLGTINLFTGQAHAQFSSPVHDDNNADLQPLEAKALVAIQGGEGIADLITAPTGKRVVVDFVAGNSRNALPGVLALIEVIDTNGLARVLLPVLVQQPPNGSGGVYSQPLKLYAEPGEHIRVQIFDNAAGTAWEVGLVGRFVSLT